MRFQVVHTTRYRYDTPASLSHNELHLRPRATPHQRLVRSEIVVDPRPGDRSDRLDVHGNGVSYLCIEGPHESLTVTSTSELELSPYDISPAALRSWEATRDAVIDPTPARELLLESPHVPLLDELEAYARPSFPPGRALLDAVRDLTSRIHRDLVFDPDVTTVSTPLVEVMAHRRGVCQDFAHVAIGALRAVGLAARYVSGYIETVPPPGQEKLIGADASHAWCAVRLADGT